MSQFYQVMVLDDEPPARDLIEVFINRIPDMRCVATCSNAMQGLQAIQDHKPDLLFLDIQMPEMTGLELMSLPLVRRPEIILTTAYPEYALASYEFSVLDYLVKPIAFDRFVKAIVKFRDRLATLTNLMDSRQIIENTNNSQSQSTIQETRINGSIWLKEEKRYIQIASQDVLYVEGLKDYVKVYLSNQMIVTHLSIGQAEKVFSTPEFIRIHRSFIVRRLSIYTIDGNVVTLVNGKELPLGPNFRDGLRNYISLIP